MQSETPTTGLPLRHEKAATGLVAAVYADIRRRMPFVPALFKAIAFDPAALELAWLQARALADASGSDASTARLRAIADPALPYRASEPIRLAVAPFARELPLMLLVVTSLSLTLEGRIPLRPRTGQRVPPAGAAPEPSLPDSLETHPLFDEIRAVYGTEHVPSMFRSLGAQGMLDEPWRAVAPFLRGPECPKLVAALTAAAEAEAFRFPDVAVFDVQQVRPTLDQFRLALPRNMLFAAAAGRA
jgi:hypothetical protein